MEEKESKKMEEIPEVEVISPQVNKKAELMKKFLADRKIECFETEELNNEYKTTVFRSRMVIRGQELPFAILIDESVYTLLQIRLAAPVVKQERSAELALFVNELNNEYRMFKFNVSQEGSVLMSTIFTAQDHLFAPELLGAVLDETMKFLEADYGKIMGKIWNMA